MSVRKKDSGGRKGKKREGEGDTGLGKPSGHVKWMCACQIITFKTTTSLGLC